MIGYYPDRVFVLGVAFKTATVRQDSAVGIDWQKEMKLNDPTFGQDTANLLKMITDMLNDKNQRVNRLSLWLEKAQRDWALIERHTNDLTQHATIQEMSNSNKIAQKLKNLWEIASVEFDEQDLQILKSFEKELSQQYSVKDYQRKLDEIILSRREQNQISFKELIENQLSNWCRSCKMSISDKLVEKSLKNLDAKRQMQQARFEAKVWLIFMQNKI